MFLVIFTALLGGGNVPVEGVELAQSTYYVGAMATFGVISACLHEHRHEHPLQPGRRDPEAPPRHAAAGLVRTCRPGFHAMVVGAILVVITLAFGRLVYDAPLPTGCRCFSSS